MFWDNFLKICETHNTKPNTVAKLIGISNATCTKWKNGAIPNGETLLKLADYLGVSVDYLLGREQQPQTSTTTTNNNNNNNHSQFDETTLQVAEEFRKLDFKDKIQVMSLIAEPSEKKGA